MELKNKFIRNRMHLRENFTIQEVMTKIDDFPAGYVDFVENFLKKAEPVDQMVLDCLDNQVSLSPEQLEELSPGFWAENEKAIEQLTADGLDLNEVKHQFCLLLLLHMQAHCPITASGLKYMQGRLDTVRSAASAAQMEKHESQGRILRITDSKNLVLPPYEGTDLTGGELVQIENPGYIPVQVSIQGTDLIRGLFHGEVLYAVKKEKAYLGFMPRLREEDQEYARKLMLTGGIVTLPEEVCPYHAAGKEIFLGDKKLLQADAVVTELAVYDHILYYRTLGSAKVWRYEHVND